MGGGMGAITTDNGRMFADLFSGVFVYQAAM